MANEEVLNLLRIETETDTTELERSLQRFQQLADAGEEIDNALTRVGRNRALDNIARDAQSASVPSDRLATALKEIGASDSDLKRVSREYERIGDAAQRATRDAQRLSDQQRRFDETSRGVQLAGDVQSNLGAISGLAGAAGAGGVASGVAVTGEIAALVEELPRLKAAAAGLPGTISTAVGALGPAGIAAGVGLAAAVVGLGLAAEDAARKIDQARQAQERRTAAVTAAAEVEGESSDVIRDTTDANLDAASTAGETLNRLTAERERLEAQFEEEFGRDVSGRSDRQLGLANRATPLFATAGDELTEQILEARNAERDALNDFLQSSESAQEVFGELGSAETELADARAQASVVAAAQSNEITQAYQAEAQAREYARTATTEQLNALLEQIDEDQRAKQQELEDQRNLNEQTETSTARIAQLESQLGNLEDRERSLEQVARPLIQRREEEEAAAERQSEALERAKEKAEEFAQTVRERFDELVQRQVDTIRQRSEDAVRFAELEREATVDTATNNLQRLRDREAALESELDALQALADSGADVSDEIRNTQTSLTNVQGDIERTFTDVLPAAVQRARQEIEKDLAADLRELESERKTAIAEAEDELTKLDEKRDAELEKIDNERADALEDFRQGEIQRLREYTRTIAKIEQQGRRDRLKAAGRLDAVALEEAIFTEEQKLQAEEERMKIETERRGEELDEIQQRFREREQERRREFDAQRQAAERELDQTRAKFDQQEAQLRANAQKELNIIGERFQREQQLYAQANNAILQGVQTLVERVRGAFGGSGGSSSGGSQISVADAAAAGKQKILEALGATGASGGGSSATNAGGGGVIRTQATIQRFNRGGVFTGASPGFAMLEPGERVLSNQQTATFDRMVTALERLASGDMGSRSATVNNTFNGFQAEQVRNITRQELISIVQR